MKQWISYVAVGAVAVSLASQGCTPGSVVPAGDGSDLAATVASKATEVASRIGGETGFGGVRMNGYMEHTQSHMGFNSQVDLASPGSMMTVMLHNQASQNCTFHLTYFSSLDSSVEQTQDVDVPAGGETPVQIPCAEIVGAGPFDTPGGVGCVLADGQQVSNMMAVPGFMGMDYACGATYHMYLTPDTNDVNGDGDTNGLILMTEAMQTHMQSGGMMGNMGGGNMQQ